MDTTVNMRRTWTRLLIPQAQSSKTLLLHKPPGMRIISAERIEVKGKIPSLCLLGIDMITFSTIREWKYKEKNLFETA